ncbi:MAG: alpha/beta fold hydrolase [Rhizobiales bacterium]|nr:alpha/beta fold hydrolase [Hyphomicrobiales bacterium]
MVEASPQFLELAGRPGGPVRRIAYRVQSGSEARPGLVWINGFRSVMTSTKVTALAAWARTNDVGLTRFDVSGVGESPGEFLNATIGDWLDELVAVVRELTSGPQVLVGSSMGGWLALLAVRRLRAHAPAIAARIRGLVLIAPAWDMTERLMWSRFPAETRETLRAEGVWYRPSAYDDGPYPLALRLIEEGRDHLIAGRPFVAGCPVRVIHGMRDPDVPWQGSLELADLLADEDVQLTLIKDGEHRLSRPRDIALMLEVIAGLIEPTATPAPGP